MKTIGLIGGMSWESTVSYYQIINRTVKEELGGFHSAKLLLYSVDFSEIEECQSNGDWDRCADILSEAAKNLESAGADFIVICTNTMHKVEPMMREAIQIPILHIADATAVELKKGNITIVALLGTQYTMTQDFYKDRIRENGIEVIVPNEDDIKIIHDVIYQELCMGMVKEESKNQYLRIIEDLHTQGAQGVILGCTEIGMLIGQKDCPLPVFDTAQIHAQTAAMESLQKDTNGNGYK